MREAWGLLREERRARRFLLVYLQSALGNGAAFVALPLLAYDRWQSPWAITLVLAADLMPSVLGGPFIGALIDRFSRRNCLIASDVLRGVAFLGIVLIPSLPVMIALAVVAGIGSALSAPAGPAWVPTLVAEEREGAAIGLLGSLNNLGHTLGPGVAAAVLLVTGVEPLLVANAVTFGLSILVLLSIPVDRPQREAAGGGSEPSLLESAREGVRVAMGSRLVRAVLIANGVAFLCVGMINVAEPLLAIETLDGGDHAYALLVAFYGFGVVVGALSGAGAKTLTAAGRGFALSFAVMAGGILGSGLAPSVAIAAVTFFVTGIGNGMMVTYQRLFIRRAVPDRLLGRIFALQEMMISIGLAAALVGGAALAQALGPRGVFVVAAIGGFAVVPVALLGLRAAAEPEPGGEGMQLAEAPAS